LILIISLIKSRMSGILYSPVESCPGCPGCPLDVQDVLDVHREYREYRGQGCPGCPGCPRSWMSEVVDRWISRISRISWMSSRMSTEDVHRRMSCWMYWMSSGLRSSKHARGHIVRGGGSAPGKTVLNMAVYSSTAAV
jgi:hypothetical protein